MDRSASGPEGEHANGQFAFSHNLLIQVPLRLRNARILRAGHALTVEVLDDFEDAVLLLFPGQRREILRDELLRRFLENPGWIAACIAIDRARGWILRFALDPGKP